MPKKGTLRGCNNWLGIALVSTPSKVLAISLINSAVDSKLVEVQAGFRQGRGCVNQTFTLRNKIKQINNALNGREISTSTLRILNRHLTLFIEKQLLENLTVLWNPTTNCLYGPVFLQQFQLRGRTRPMQIFRIIWSKTELYSVNSPPQRRH
ncbi:endonuclease-reverse transcriptase HmRTE-e01 [Elysia marginata]|uniref:Endonuclease-reverse transcriptase HmRTE-e01 n=1 Tax=Elysia marginata TaxID=1093978 RepID=A0AAV4H9V3_9GAST|nr:endonuclease-reverse transcriptase HmRTE-e01 [Elysia marginata]